jgi:hypothetical protein
MAKVPVCDSGSTMEDALGCILVFFPQFGFNLFYYKNKFVKTLCIKMSNGRMDMPLEKFVVKF